MRQRLWQWYLLASLVAGACYFVLPREGVGQAIVFTGFTVASSVALVVGVRLHRPRHSAAWYLLASGMVFNAVANVVWHTKPPFPSVADVLYLCAYSLLVGGFVVLVRRRSQRRYHEAVLDALVVAGGAGVLAWVFLMQPYVHLSGLSPLARVVSMSYSAMDVLLLAALVSLVFTRGVRRLAVAFLAVGAAGQLYSDVNYAVSLLDSSFRFGASYFGGWLVAYTLIGAAALHPSMVELSEPAPVAADGSRRARLLMLATAAMIPPVTLITRELTGPADTETVIVVTATSAVLFVLVLSRVAGLMSDLTEYRRLQRLKDEFVSIVSHELRTPLTSIRGSLGLLAGGVLTASPAKAERMLQLALDNTDRLVRLINDILDIERMESGSVSLERRSCDADQLVHQAADTMRADAARAGVTLDVNAAPGVLRADADRILQTLINLLSNAIKFSPEGATVWLSCAARDGEMLFGVRDEGRGVPPDQLERIFERFQQVDSSDAREKGGTGLGLAICRSIVEQHGGRIWAESVEGEGSTFQFALPAASGQQSHPPGASAEPPVAAARPRILICDDDPGVREVVGAMLEQRGYDVVAAASGREALELAAAERPDAIVLDLLMPGMSGCETALELSQEPQTQDIPLVILSVLSQDETMPPPVAISDWVSKPPDEQTLFGALERALTGQRGFARVLIVEDDVDLATMLIALFERHGLQVMHAATGADAIELSRDLQPDLLILDVGLPEGDGFWVAEWLRQHDRLRGVPIVVHTARDLDAEQRRRLDTGNTRFVTKGAVTLEQFEHVVLGLVGALAPLGGDDGR